LIYSVSILCSDRPRMTQRCIETVLQQSPASADEVELLLTDNGTGPKTRGILDQMARDRRVKLHRNSENLGVCAPKQAAFARSSGRYFVSLDNDCTVRPGWLEALRQPLDLDQMVAQSGRRGAFCQLDGNAVGTRGARVDYVDGSCFMVRSAAVRELTGGLCDPAFVFAYCEDADLSLRLRKAGLKIQLTAVPVTHREHGTAGAGGSRVRKAWARNHATLVKRWRGYLRTRTFGHPGEPTP